MPADLTNQDRLDQRRQYAGPVFLKEGFRPLFLGAGLWAAISVPLWILVWTGELAYSGVFDAPVWHVHEMIFGFVAAALGGFALTAVPNWTGRLPVRGTPLAVLAGLWLAGRVAVWFAAVIGAPAAAAIDLLYLAALVLFFANEIVAGKNWRNVPIVGAVFLLLAGNVLFHIDAIGLAETGGIALRLSVSVVLMLIAVIGGRVVPSFTRNWFAKNDGPEIAAPMLLFDRLTLAVSIAAFVLWIGLEDGRVAGVGLAVAGAMHLARLARWRGWRTISEPLVTILHIGYFWIGIGLIALGASMLGGPVGQTAALHILTIGGMATMILAVMTRAILGHTGQALTADMGTVTIYVLVTLALFLRLGNEVAPSIELVWAAALAWTAGFGLFVAIYTPRVLRGD